MRRCLPWLALLSPACFETAFPDFPTEGRSCPVLYLLEGVADGEPVLLDWTALEADGGDKVNQVILGRLPLNREQVMRSWCRGDEADYDWTETLEVEPGTLTLELTPEQVGEPGTTTVVGLRAGDREVGTVGLSAVEEGQKTEVMIEGW